VEATVKFLLMEVTLQVLVAAAQPHLPLLLVVAAATVPHLPLLLVEALQRRPLLLVVTIVHQRLLLLIPLPAQVGHLLVVVVVPKKEVGLV
jgi:hypothetical protein